MYYVRQFKSSLLVLCVLSTILISSSLAESDEEIFQSKPKQKQAVGKQYLPNLSFALPGLGLIQSRSNIFAKSTVTRTVLSTVATITAASFRTCTTTGAMALPACAGRRKRELFDGENELDGGYKPEVDATPSIKLIIGKTEITDPASIAEILNEKPVQSQQDIVKLDEQVVSETTTNSQVIFERNLDGTTVLYPSQDSPNTVSPNGQEIEVDDDVLNDDKFGTTVETPYSDSIVEATTLDPNRLEEEITSDTINNNNEKARVGLGNGGVVTVTSMIPITHVVQTAATGTAATLTVSYAGCMPPSLPVYGQQCTMP